MKLNKKIAVAVVGALAFAGITALPSQAAPTVTYTTMYDTTNGVQVVNGLATLTLHTDTSTVDSVAITGVGSIVQAVAGTNTTINIAPFAAVTGGVNTNYQLTNSSAGAGTSTLILYSQTLGTSTVTVTPINNSTGIAGTAVSTTVTWTSNGTLAANTGYTTSYIAANNTTPTSTTDSVAIIANDSSGTTAGTEVANILVSPHDGNNHALASEAITAIVSGSGLVGIGSSAGSVGMQGRAVTGAAGAYDINVFGDGTPGTSTITIEDGSTVLATKTLIFGGTAAKFSPSNEFGVYRVGSNGLDGVSTTQGSGIAVTVTDANGNPVPNGTTIYAVSNTPAIATVSASATTTGGVAYFGVTGVSVGTASFTFNNQPVGSATAPTATANDTVTVGSSVASKVTLSFDNTSYANGSVVKLKLTALDASGNPISDVAAVGYSYTNFLSADFVSSVALGGATLTGSATPTFVSGVATWNLYAPLTAGPFTVTGTTGTTSGLALSAQKLAISASAQVADQNASANSSAITEAADAANAATTAANAATTAAQAATTAATQASAQAASALAAVNALSAKIATLATSLAKILKKLGIK